MKQKKSEQYMIAHEEGIEGESVDLDTRFRRIDDPVALAEFARVRAESEAGQIQINEETQTFIQAENAKVHPDHEKSEQYMIQFLPSLSDSSATEGR